MTKFCSSTSSSIERFRAAIIYAPRSHRQMIIQANNVTTDFKTFDVNPSATEFYFNGLRIVFVPIPEKVTFVL
jgi:hypothetical protein